MRHLPPTLAAACALLLSMTLHGPEAHAAAASDAAAAPAARARVIVKFKPESTLLQQRQTLSAPAAQIAGSRAHALGQRMGLSLRAGASIADRTQVVLADGVNSTELAARLSQQSDVEYAVIDQRRRRLAVPNDPLYTTVGGNGPATGQWYLRAPTAEVPASINAEDAWDTTTGTTDVVVAVLDTGVRFDHADLVGGLHAGYDFIADLPTSNDGNGRDADASDPGDWITEAESNQAGGEYEDCEVADSSWHGTQVTGVIGATTDNGIGMASVGRNVMILPVRVLGKCGGFDSDIIAGMRWSAGLPVPGVPANPNPARVINLSLGGDGICDASTGYPDAVSEINAAGAVIVASAGNSAGHAVGVPANCPGVIAVGGLRHAGTKVGFSDLGPEVSLSAPAGNCVDIGPNDPCVYPLLTTTNAGTRAPVAASSIYTDSFNISLGTSFSAPLVAGTAALMLSVDPSLTPLDVRLIMQATARPFPTTGGDNGDGTEVLECTAPQYDDAGDPVDQLQCYCSTGTCGAGMVDARAAVLAVLTGTPLPEVDARIDISPLAPVAEATVQLSGAQSTVASGRTITSYQWSLIDGGGIVSGIANSTLQVARVVPTGAGRFKVRLTVLDSGGGMSTADLTMEVAAAPPAPEPEPEPEPTPSGGGGGGLGWHWLLALAAAVAALRRTDRHANRP